MRLGRRAGRIPADLGDPEAYPESWLYPIEGRWLKQLRSDADRALELGMRPGVFAKVGDSNLLGYNSLYGLGCREPVWGEHEELEPVMRRYRQVELPPGGDIDFVHCPDAADRRPWNSFSRVTAAAMMGIVAAHLVNPREQIPDRPTWWRDDPDRLPGESAIETEVRLVRPLFAFVQIGTNGLNYGNSPRETADAAADLIKRVRRLGPVPVLLNLTPQLNHPATPPRWEFAEETAGLMAEVAARERVPLVNLWLPLATGDFENHGLVGEDGVIFDGVHLDTFGGFDAPDALGKSVDFRPEALKYGTNYRNLVVLKVLEELDRLVT